MRTRFEGFIGARVAALRRQMMRLIRSLASAVLAVLALFAVMTLCAYCAPQPEPALATQADGPGITVTPGSAAPEPTSGANEHEEEQRGTPHATRDGTETPQSDIGSTTTGRGKVESANAPLGNTVTPGSAKTEVDSTVSETGSVSGESTNGAHGKAHEPAGDTASEGAGPRDASGTAGSASDANGHEATPSAGESSSPSDSPAPPDAAGEVAQDPLTPRVDATVAADGDGLALDVAIAGLAAPATLRVTLGAGIKPRPGAYVSGDVVGTVRGIARGGSAVVEVGVTSNGTVRVATLGMPAENALAQSIEMLADDGAVLAELGPTDAGLGSDVLARVLADIESAPFTTVGYYENTTTPTLNRIPRIANADSGTTAYCNDMLLDAPGDPNHGSSEPVWYERWYFPDDPTQAAQHAQNPLDYLLFHGYPTDPTIGGLCDSEQDAEAATQWAIWHFTNPGSTPFDEAPLESWSAGFRSAYDTLVTGAASYDAACQANPGAFTPERGTCEMWVVETSGLQNLMTANPRYGWLDLTKSSTRPELIDGATYSLAGATFDVLGPDGSVAATLTTDAEGKASCLLAVGTYRVIETKAPAGHALDTTPREVSIAGGPTHAALAIEDPALLGGLAIVKRAGTLEGPPLPGATFSLTPAGDGEPVATLTTDETGRASTGSQALPLGRYVLSEISAPDGCATAADVEVVIDEMATEREVEIVDPYDTTVLVTKTDATTGRGLAGARLQVLDAQGVVVEEWASDGETRELRGLAPGSYVLHEVEAPDGYALATDVRFEVRLTSEHQQVTMADELARAPFAFTKLDAATREPLHGAIFALYRPTGELPEQLDAQDIRNEELWEFIEMQPSDEQGRVNFGELEQGSYLLLEESVPQGYVRPGGGWLVRIVAGEVQPEVVRVGGTDNPPFENVDGELSLVNYRQAELPQTGGTGTFAPLVTGATLVAAGVAVSHGARQRIRRAVPVMLFVLVATLAMLAMSLPMLALASPSELPDPARAASLTIHKYALPDDVRPGASASGKPDEAGVPSQATPLEGIGFTIRRAYSQGEADALVSQGSAQASDFSPATGSDGEDNGFAGYVLRAGDEELSGVTGADGSLTFDLTGRQGTWLVTEKPDPRVEMPCDPFIASVPMPDPTNDRAWLYDVHVYPKNYRIDVDKVIVQPDGTTTMHTSAAIGEPVTFRITADIPAAIGKARSYVITDQLDWRISTTDGVPESLKVTAAGIELQNGKDYVTSIETKNNNEGAACQRLSWDFTPGLARLQEAVDASQNDTPKVDIEFVARLNSNADYGVLENEAALAIQDEIGTEQTFETPHPKVSFGSIRIDKCQANDLAAKLHGATFRIASSIENARNEEWLHKLAPGGADAGTWEETTGSDGVASFAGLKFDLEEGADYFLVETQAPEGFEAITEPIRVHVGPGDGESEASLMTNVQVLNAPEPQLPGTGGHGSSTLVIGGAVVLAVGMAAAVVFGVRRSRQARRWS